MPNFNQTEKDTDAPFNSTVPPRRRSTLRRVDHAVKFMASLTVLWDKKLEEKTEVAIPVVFQQHFTAQQGEDHTELKPLFNRLHTHYTHSQEAKRT